MNNHHLGWVFMFGMLACTACESSTQVGSACPSGMCPELSTVLGATCLVSDFTAALAPDMSTDEFCVPGGPLPLDDSGLAACEMEWDLAPAVEALDPSDPTHCSDRAFLAPTASSGLTQGGETCIVSQLSAEEYASGAQGWFYEHDPSGNCGGAGGAIRFSDEVQPTGVVEARLHCGFVLAEDDGGTRRVDASECAEPAASGTAAGVGDACMPIVPDGGFDDRDAYVETGASECETGTCLVFRLNGDPASDCVPSADRACATPEEVEQRVYCSCRCDAHGGPGPECDCRDGFTCVDILQRGPAELSGGYCVRNGSFTDP